MVKHKVSEFLYYNARENDFLIISYDSELMNHHGLSPISFERYGVHKIDILTKVEFERVMDFAKQWEYVGEI